MGKDEERSPDKPSKIGRNLAGETSKAKQIRDLLLLVVPSLWLLCDLLDTRSHQSLGESNKLTRAKQRAPSLSLGYLRAM